MKALVTGVCGQLGHDIMNELASRGLQGIGTDLAPKYAGKDGEPVSSMPYVSMDITDRDHVLSEVAGIEPDVIFHCAAWTAVDAAEDPANIDKVRAINAQGTENLAEAARKSGAAIVYLSTDYVFDGQGTQPWDPDCKSFRPLNVYGQTKLEGEQAVAALADKFFIVRIAWVFGANGQNFVKTMLRLGRTHDMLRVVDDQIGTPTYTYDLARLLVDMALTDKYGYYHVTKEGGFISWYEFACEIFRQAGMDVRVIPVSTAEYGLSRAARPFNSRLDKEKLLRNGFVPLPDWRDALARYLGEIEVPKE